MQAHTLKELIDYCERDDFSFDIALPKVGSVFGFKNVMFNVLHREHPCTSPTFSYSTFPKKWKDHYNSKHSSNDPVLKHAVNRSIPFCWEEVNYSDHKHQEFKQEFNTANLGATRVSIPLTDKDGNLSIFTILSDLTGDDFLEFKQYNIVILRDIGQMLHVQYIRQQKTITQLPEFTSRENQIIQLFAEGKTAQEISKDLKISTSVVTTYMRNIRYKLNIIKAA